MKRALRNQVKTDSLNKQIGAINSRYCAWNQAQRIAREEKVRAGNSKRFAEAQAGTREWDKLEREYYSAPSDESLFEEWSELFPKARELWDKLLAAVEPKMGSKYLGW